jgi:hypothetical protein
VVSHIISHKNPKAPTKSRLVDFNVFCDRIKDSPVVDGQKLILGLLSMIDSQLRQLKESSQAINLLEQWISSRPHEAEDFHTWGEIFTSLQMMCSAQKIDFRWKNAAGLGRHLSTLKTRLEVDYGAEFKEFPSPDSAKELTKIRFRINV